MLAGKLIANSQYKVGRKLAMWSVGLAPRFTSKTMLVASLADDALLTKALLGYQTRDANTGRTLRWFQSGAKGKGAPAASGTKPAKNLLPR